MTPAELTEALEALHLNQRKFAALIGRHHTVVNRWKMGHSPIPPEIGLVLDGIWHRQHCQPQNQQAPG